MLQTTEVNAHVPATVYKNVSATEVGATALNSKKNSARASVNNGGSVSPSKDAEEAAVGCHKNKPALWSFGPAVLTGVLLLVALTIWLTSREYWSHVTPKKTPPNIVFILADDLGWADVSYNGNPQILTPNIDALAWNGVRLTRLYHHNLCTPSRAAIMTGRHPIHIGMQNFVIRMSEPRGLSLDLKLLPEWLNDLGYTSYMLGKWHLGFHQAAYTPTKRGFVSHVGSWGGACEYYSHERAAIGSNDYGLDFRRNLSLAPQDSGRYYTEIVTEEAISIITNHPVDKPMFLHVAHLAPHYGTVRTPLEAPRRHVEGYEFVGDKNRTVYAGMVSALDESVGKIFAALQEKGMLENTLLSFSSDNGAAATFWGVNAASPSPLRGEKSTLWEGGVRVPGFVWTAKPLWHGPGSEYERFFHVTDWLPTLYEMAGGDTAKLLGVDGVSHLKSLANPTSDAPRSEVLLNIDPVDGNAGIIRERYKLVVGTFPDGSSDWIEIPGARKPAEEEAEAARQSCLNSTAYQVLSSRGANPNCGSARGAYSTPVACGDNGLSKAFCDSARQPCLYDIIADPCEYHDIANENPEIVRRLQDSLAAYEKGAVKPGNLEQDPASLPGRHGAMWVTWKDDVPV